MNFRPYFQQKLKVPPKFGYNTQNNFYGFGMKGLIKKNRDITPFRKYNKTKKKNPTNNIYKNSKDSMKNLKIEGELITSSKFGMKRPKSPINNIGKKSISKKSPNNNKNMNMSQLHFNYSIKPSRNIFKQFSKGKTQNNYYSPISRNNKIKINRAVTPNNELLKTKNYKNNKFKFNRSTTPMPKSNFSLKNSRIIFKNDKIFNSKNIGSKSPLLGYKNKSFVSPNSRPRKMNLKEGLNMHYNNYFKSKNIFAKFSAPKNKRKVITINMNLNQNFLSASSKIYNDDTNNKTTSRTAPLSEQTNYLNNNSINDLHNNNYSNNDINNILNNNSNKNSNYIINDVNNKNLSDKNIIINKDKNIKTNFIIDNCNNSNSFSIINKIYKFNNISKIESNSSLIIKGIPKVKENNEIIIVDDDKTQKEVENKVNSNSPKQVRKKIMCMHEFSKTGYAGEDEKKVNQDNYFVFHNFVNNINYIFMAVCDGHGAVGQEISSFLKENLPIDLNHALRKGKKDILKDDISDIITNIFIQENNKLISNEMINSVLSGSTCVSAIYTPIKLITANVGDSRIILGKYFHNLNKWLSVDLTRDHKPSLPEEEKRILEKGGRIEPMKDEDNTFIGPPRVWLKEQDYPGLAMSRSFGDRLAHSVGVSEVPEIKEYFFSKEDKFFVVASDGLFEFISSQNIVEVIKDYYLNGDIVGCCEYLYKLSRIKWMKEEEVVDDITMILVFLEDE